MVLLYPNVRKGFFMTLNVRSSTAERVSNTQPQQNKRLPQGSPLQNKTEQVGKDVICNACNKVNPKAELCGRCKSTYYCNRECQKKDWKDHKEVCAPKVTFSLDLSPFKSNSKKIGNQYIPVYIIDPSSPSPINNLFQISDLAETIGCMAMDEFKKEIGDYKNTAIDVSSSQISNIYIRLLNNWMLEAKSKNELSEIFQILLEFKKYLVQYLKQRGHEDLKIPAGELTAFTLTLHEEMITNLWLNMVFAYPDYALKNIHEIIKSIPEIEPTEMNCLTFAFLMAGEKKFVDALHSDLASLLKNLQKWNYYPVKDPQEGDIVVYFHSKNKEQTTNIGYITSSGKVLSKPKNGYSFAIEYPVNHFSLLFGKGGIAFYRKKTESA